MNISALYESLDDLAMQASTIPDEFAQSGDLKQLSTDLTALGSRAYQLSRGVDDIINALKFEE